MTLPAQVRYLNCWDTAGSWPGWLFFHILRLVWKHKICLLWFKFLGFFWYQYGRVKECITRSELCGDLIGSQICCLPNVDMYFTMNNKIIWYLLYELGFKCDKIKLYRMLVTFRTIVSIACAHSCCAQDSCCNITPHHSLSVEAKEET